MNEIKIPTGTVLWGLFWINILFAIISAPNDYELNFSHIINIFNRSNQGIQAIDKKIDNMATAIEKAVLKDGKTNNNKSKSTR